MGPRGNYKIMGAVMLKILFKNVELFFFVVVCGFSLSGNSAGKAALYNQLQVTPGKYEKIKGDLDKCQADVVDLAWEGDEANKVLRVGEKFIFAHLEQTSFTSPGLNSCNSKTITSVTDKQVIQARVDECPNKKNNQERIQTLTFDGDKMAFDFQIKNQPKVSFKCEYVKVKK